LKDWLTGIAPNAIIISPLSRAIQTYCHMRQGTDFATTIWAEPRISELASDGSHENMGRRLKDLREDWVLNMLEDPFNEIDFSRIDGVNDWWNGAFDKANQNLRMQAWLDELSQMPGPVVVVCHFNVIRRLSNISRPKNAFPYQCVIRKLGDTYSLESGET